MSAADSPPMPAVTIVDSPGDASDSPPAPAATIVCGPGDAAGKSSVS
jgi:hypothetical protein